LSFQIKASATVDDQDKCNIADLAVSVIGKTGFKPTVQLYMGLAFLVSDKYTVHVLDSSLLFVRDGMSSITRLSNRINGGFKSIPH